jgi:hypothetical protein
VAGGVAGVAPAAERFASDSRGLETEWTGTFLALACTMLRSPMRRSAVMLALALAIGAGLAAGTARAERVEASSAAQAAPSREESVRIMVEGSLEVSRTKVEGRRFLASPSLRERQIARTAERNFREAARFVVDNADRLQLNRDTAIAINRLVTRGLVPEGDRGNHLYRPVSGYSSVTDDFVGGDVERFYRWLASAGTAAGPRDPVLLAERIHHNMSALDSFPDGNGRTARIMADLALLKHGRAPALYTHMADYFVRGSPRAPGPRADRLAYFREIAARGQARARELRSSEPGTSALRSPARRLLRHGPKRPTRASPQTQAPRIPARSGSPAPRRARR